MQKKLFFLVSLLLTISLTAMAQVTTSGISGKVTSNGEEIIIPESKVVSFKAGKALKETVAQ